MADGKHSDLTPGEKVLQHDADITKGAQLNPRGDAPSKPKWLEILNSTAFSTLVTVLIGGIFGQFLLSSYQEKQRRSDLAQDQFRQYIQRQQEVMQQALDLVGAADFDAAALLQLAAPFDSDEVAGSSERKRIQDQRASLLENHIKTIKDWNTSRRQMGLLLTYYNYGRPDIKSAWESTEGSATQLMNCAQNALEHHTIHNPSDDPCKFQKSSLDNSLDQLANAFEQSRQYAWQMTPFLTSTK